MAHRRERRADAHLTTAARALSLTGAVVGVLLVLLLAVGASLEAIMPGGYVMIAAAVGVLASRVALFAIHTRE